MLKLLLAVPLLGALAAGLASRRRNGGFAAMAAAALASLCLAIAAFGQSLRTHASARLAKVD